MEYRERQVIDELIEVTQHDRSIDVLGEAFKAAEELLADFEALEKANKPVKGSLGPHQRARKAVEAAAEGHQQDAR